jgi:hypothetical protein
MDDLPRLAVPGGEGGAEGGMPIGERLKGAAQGLGVEIARDPRRGRQVVG